MYNSQLQKMILEGKAGTSGDIVEEVSSGRWIEDSD